MFCFHFPTPTIFFCFDCSACEKMMRLGRRRSSRHRPYPSQTLMLVHMLCLRRRKTCARPELYADENRELTLTIFSSSFFFMCASIFIALIACAYRQQLSIALRESKLARRVLTKDSTTEINGRNVQKRCPYESIFRRHE